MKLVQQRGSYDCGAACLAMILECSVEEVERDMILRKVGELRDPKAEHADGIIGVTCFEIGAVLWDEGIRSVLIPGYEEGPEAVETGPNWYARIGQELPVMDLTRRVVQHLQVDAGPAILGVPSLGLSDEWQHWIVAEGFDLYDPTIRPGRRYHRLGEPPAEQLKIYEAILIDGSYR